MPSGRTVSGTELLRRAQAGDVESLDALLAGTRDHLFRVAQARLPVAVRGKADQADVIQDALLEIHRRLPQFRGASEVEYWVWARRILQALAANHTRHYLGTRQRDVRLERRIDDDRQREEPELSSSGPGPSELAERRETSLLLHDALRLLPDHYRQVVVLRLIEGLSFAEVAERMDRSVDSVEKVHKRALECLRRNVRGESPQ